MKKAVFLDRDGVLNVDPGHYVWTEEELEPEYKIGEACQQLHEAGFRLVVVTNQAGIAKGLYDRQQMERMHQLIQKWSGGLISHFYYSPYHPDFSGESLSRKPGTLLFQKGLAKYDLDPGQCWMVGDRERDLIPARALGMKTIQVMHREEEFVPDYKVANLYEALPIILEQ